MGIILIQAQQSLGGGIGGVSSSGDAREHEASLLVRACERNYTAVVETLLSKSVDPAFSRPSDGVLPIAVAAVHGSIEVLMTLLNHSRVQINQPDERSGRTALHLACQLGQDKVVKILLDYGADPRVEAPGGRTALHLACENGSVGALEVLLKHAGLEPIDVLKPNARNVTALSAAHRRGYVAITEMLLAFAGSSTPSQGNQSSRTAARSCSPQARRRPTRSVSGMTPRESLVSSLARGDTVDLGHLRALAMPHQKTLQDVHACAKSTPREEERSARLIRAASVSGVLRHTPRQHLTHRCAHLSSSMLPCVGCPNFRQAVQLGRDTGLGQQRDCL